MRRFGGPLVRQVMVVDNASSDGSPEMVATEFPEVLLIRSKQNVGFACANNIGLQYVASPFVAMVNSDVNIHKECFERLSEVLVEQSQVGLVGPKAFWPRWQATADMPTPSYLMEHFLSGLRFRQCFFEMALIFRSRNAALVSGY